MTPGVYEVCFLPLGYILPLRLPWDLLALGRVALSRCSALTAGTSGNRFTSINVVILTSLTIWERNLFGFFFPNICEILSPLRENRRVAGEPDQIFWLSSQPLSPCRQEKKWLRALHVGRAKAVILISPGCSTQNAQQKREFPCS